MKKAGIDIGTMFVKAVVLSEDGRTDKQCYQNHQGNRAQALSWVLNEIGLVDAIALTGTGDHRLAADPRYVDPVKALRMAVAKAFPAARNIIDVGFANVTLVEIGAEQTLARLSSNSLCAAGTGSFLDEQMIRLGLAYPTLSELPFEENPPSVATRCAVFAKTDIVHKQQEGFSPAQLWDGLCRSMAKTALQTLAKGKRLRGLTVLTGGVTRNSHFVRRFAGLLPDGLELFPNGYLAAALGAAMLADPAVDKSGAAGAIEVRPVEANPPLVLNRSVFPAFSEPVLDEDQNEIEAPLPLSESNRAFYLGIDIGSTSTKTVLMTPSGRVAVSLYRRTLGDPIGAVKKLFSSIDRLARKAGVAVKILGAATTGSGRKLIGNLISADVVVNEITAQAAGATADCPDADVVFEIGGQDSKYILLNGAGRVTDCNMNFICAAGTGSFIEEQARKLGFALPEIAGAVLGATPPRTSERCTVFMEQDIVALLSKGYSQKECMAAVCYSVVRNYLNKVVENRALPKTRLVFQGATAKNAGLVAAFENTLNLPVVVSPHCHVTGAWGAARICREKMSDRPSSFMGLDFARREVRIRYEPCNLCGNSCTLTFADVSGRAETSWGYLCGRDPDEAQARPSVHFEPFKAYRKAMQRGPGADNPRWKVGIPQALTTFTYLPLWRSFFSRIGARVVTSGKTGDRVIAGGNGLVGADFCYPIKLYHGHAAMLAERDDLDLIFMPLTVSEPEALEKVASWYCVYTQGAPSLVSAVIEKSKAPWIQPAIDFRRGVDKIAADLARELSRALGIEPDRTVAAFREAMEEFHSRVSTAKAIGLDALQKLEQEDRTGIVIVGRPYTIHDDTVNQKLPQKIAEYGYTVIPMECLPGKDRDPLWFMYWRYGRDMLHALQSVAENPRLFAVALTNFNCGPDSFVLSYAQHVMGEKPMLTLQMDEHSADAGYVTRLEAFLDVIEGRKVAARRATFPKPVRALASLRNRRVLFPRIHPVIPELLAALFRGYDMDGAVLPIETRQSHQTGLRVTRGSECMPTALTIGALLTELRNGGHSQGKTAYFMISSGGPCLVGQYIPLHRMILDREGFSDVEIFGPNSMDSLQGFERSMAGRVWDAMTVGDLLMKMTCRVRPYELTQGQADRAFEEGRRILAETFENGRPLSEAMKSVAGNFADIRVEKGAKPLVGIVGDFYVRFNEYSNEDVIRAIEGFGGEAWLSPMIESFFYFLNPRPPKTGGVWETIRGVLIKRLGLYFVQAQEKLWYRRLPLIADRADPIMLKVEKAAGAYLSPHARSEAIINLGRAYLFAQQGVRLIAHCSPFACMPGNVSAALFTNLQADIGVPIVNLIYDGHGDQNRLLGTYLANL